MNSILVLSQKFMLTFDGSIPLLAPEMKKFAHDRSKIEWFTLFQRMELLMDKFTYVRSELRWFTDHRYYYDPGDYAINSYFFWHCHLRC